jgi:hypothetical protein
MRRRRRIPVISSGIDVSVAAAIAVAKSGSLWVAGEVDRPIE